MCVTVGLRSFLAHIWGRYEWDFTTGRGIFGSHLMRAMASTCGYMIKDNQYLLFTSGRLSIERGTRPNTWHG
jgi:hypothetical protein